MPRRRPATLSSEFPTARFESSQLQLQPVEPNRKSLRDAARFLREIIEIERVRGLRVHPESPTRH